MISRKITYHGNFSPEAVALIFDITRKNEITGEVKAVNSSVVELNLEGDPSVIKLIQHQIDRKAKEFIANKTVTAIPFQYFKGINLLR